MPRVTTIYVVFADDAMEHEIAVPTLKEAREVRAVCNPGEGAITRLTVNLGGIRQTLCNLFNREGFVTASKEVEPNKPYGPKEEEE